MTYINKNTRSLQVDQNVAKSMGAVTITVLNDKNKK